MRMFVLAAALAVVASAAHAATDGVAYFAGRWTVAAADPAGKDPTILVDYRVEAAAGGAWLFGTGTARDGSLNSRDVWGKDPQTGELVRHVFDASGAVGVVRSPGWQGDRLVLEGDVRSPGGTVRVRESITRLGPDRFRAVWEAHRNGAWSAYSIETATRAG